MKNFIPFILSFLIFSCTKSYNPAVVSARQEASEIGLEIMKKGSGFIEFEDNKTDIVNT